MLMQPSPMAETSRLPSLRFCIFNPLMTQGDIKSRQLQRVSNCKPRQTSKGFQRKDFNPSPNGKLFFKEFNEIVIQA